MNPYLNLTGPVAFPKSSATTKASLSARPMQINLILEPLTKGDDGETVLIQDYGLTACVELNPERFHFDGKAF